MIDVEPIYVAYVPLNRYHITTVRMPFDQVGAFVGRMKDRVEAYEISRDRRTAINRLCLCFGCLDESKLCEVLTEMNRKRMITDYPPNKKTNDDYKDTSNYHGAVGCYEPINVMEHMAREYAKRGIPADKAMELCLALKYILRAGTKDAVEKELFKAENFIHRARTDLWMKGDKTTIGEQFKEAPTPKQLDEDINGDR